MANYWHAGDAPIESRAKADPRQYTLEDREINVAKEDNEAGEEQEQGKVEERGQGIDGPWQETLLDAFSEERTDACALVWLVSRLSDLEISSCPLLQERRKQSTSEANYQAHEPKCIDPNCMDWWREGGWGKRRGR